MTKIMQWAMAATLIFCGAMMLTSCSNDDNPAGQQDEYAGLLSRTSSLMIRQNSILMAKLTNPDILADIQMTRYGSFDYHKSEKIIAIGRLKTALAISKYEHLIV